ncbi:hypothetical protein C8Q77DRAFT_1270579 [Trametes polyzona]|nr:hypothetical protein C8Q77DRAFT_1270579 [Trametes polyzona]
MRTSHAVPMSPDDALFGPMLPFNPAPDFSYLDRRTFSFPGRGNDSDDFDNLFASQPSTLVLDVDVGSSTLPDEGSSTIDSYDRFPPLPSDYVLPSTPDWIPEPLSSPTRPVLETSPNCEYGALREGISVRPSVSVPDSDSEDSIKGGDGSTDDDDSEDESSDEDEVLSIDATSPTPSPVRAVSFSPAPPSPTSSADKGPGGKTKRAPTAADQASRHGEPSLLSQSPPKTVKQEEEGVECQEQDGAFTPDVRLSPPRLRRSTRLQGIKRDREADNQANTVIHPESMTSRAAAIPSPPRKRLKTTRQHAGSDGTSSAALAPSPFSGDRQKCGLDGGKCQYTITHNFNQDNDHLNVKHGNTDGHGRYRCTHPGCTAKVEVTGTGYGHKCDRNRHVISSHWTKKPQYACTQPGCDRVYTQMYTLQRHMADKHGRQKRVRNGQFVLAFDRHILTLSGVHVNLKAALISSGMAPEEATTK